MRARNLAWDGVTLHDSYQKEDSDGGGGGGGKAAWSWYFPNNGLLSMTQQLLLCAFKLEQKYSNSNRALKLSGTFLGMVLPDPHLQWVSVDELRFKPRLSES